MSKIAQKNEKKFEPWQVRAFEEFRDLEVKIAALKESLRKSVLANLRESGSGFDDETTLELFEQLIPMEEYFSALRKRISKF